MLGTTVVTRVSYLIKMSLILGFVALEVIVIFFLLGDQLSAYDSVTYHYHTGGGHHSAAMFAHYHPGGESAQGGFISHKLILLILLLTVSIALFVINRQVGVAQLPVLSLVN